MDYQITREDQEKINTFGKLHTQMKEFQAQVDEAQRELLAIQDASTDALSMDEDATGLMMRVGECFFDVTPDEAVEQLEKRESEAQQKVDDLQKKVTERREQLDTLKHELYDKFGRGAINLDE